MAKKSEKKKTTHSKKTHKPAKPSAPSLEKALIDNFVNLQKVLTNLAVKFESLSDQISKLLQLFEISAKSFVEKKSSDFEGKSKDKEFLDKLDTLLNQNKTIAKGLTLIESRLRKEAYEDFAEEKERPRYPRF